MPPDPDAPLPAGFLDRIDRSEFSIPELMGLVIHEAGGPVPIERIAARLGELGIRRTVASLRKTWSRLPTIRKMGDGSLSIIPRGEEIGRWDHVLWKVRRQLGLLPKRAPEAAAAPKPEPVPLDDATPVTMEELRQTFRSGPPGGLSGTRIVGLLVEAAGGRLALERAVEAARELGLRWDDRTVRRALSHASSPSSISATGEIVLRWGPAGLAPARAIFREAIQRAERDAARAPWTDVDREAAAARWRAESRTRDSERRRAYAAMKKVAIRCVFDRRGFRAASFLDPDTREFEDLEDAASARSRLAAADIIFGIEPWKDLERLGLPVVGRRLVDLSPPLKTIRLNRAGRVLRVTPNLVISSTLRISHGLGDPAKIARYLRTEESGKLFRRLRSDLKALWRLYEHGCLHGCVRITWGFLDRIEGVDWNTGQLPRVLDVCQEAKEAGDDVEVVVGGPPAWDDPWGRARRAHVDQARHDRLILDFVDGEGTSLVDPNWVSAIRPWKAREASGDGRRESIEGGLEDSAPGAPAGSAPDGPEGARPPAAPAKAPSPFRWPEGDDEVS